MLFSKSFRNKGDPVMAGASAGLSDCLTRAGEWQMFLEHDRFCVRMCNPALSKDLQKAYCPHKYDELGCARDPADFFADRLRRVERAVELRPWLRLVHRRQWPAARPVPAAWRLALDDVVQGLVDLRPGPEADAVAASRAGLVQVHDLLAAGALVATARPLTVQTYTTYAQPQKAARATATPKPKQTNTKGKRNGACRLLGGLTRTAMATQLVRRAAAL